MTNEERERLREAIEPFMHVLRLRERPRPVTPASWWDTPIDVDGVARTIGDFARLAGVLYVDFDEPPMTAPPDSAG